MELNNHGGCCGMFVLQQSDCWVGISKIVGEVGLPVRRGKVETEL